MYQRGPNACWTVTFKLIIIKYSYRYILKVHVNTNYLIFDFNKIIDYKLRFSLHCIYIYSLRTETTVVTIKIIKREYSCTCYLTILFFFKLVFLHRMTNKWCLLIWSNLYNIIMCAFANSEVYLYFRTGNVLIK